MLTPRYPLAKICPENGQLDAQYRIIVRNGRLWRDVKFNLTYDGELLSANDKRSRVKNKNQIRFQLSAQLGAVYQAADFKRFQLDQKTISEAGYYLRNVAFIPLLTRKMNASCSLVIRFMRNEHPGQIVHRGDLDNRLKTLFDALRLPENDNEVLPELAPPSQTGEPFCVCLLEDDALITDLSVQTAMIMTPLPEGHVRLVIDVEFRPFDFLPP